MKEYTNAAWTESSAPPISAVMLGYANAVLLERALASLALAVKTRWELVLVLNHASDEVFRTAQRWLSKNVFPMRVLQLDKGETPGSARNFGAREARAPLLFFLDDDVELFQDVFAEALRIFQNSSIGAAGGPNLTPPASGVFALASGDLFASRLGAARMSARYRDSGREGRADEHSLILCNLAVRKDLFLRSEGFPPALASNEENVLLQRWEREGVELLASPKLAVYHSRRPRLAGLVEQCIKYGRGRSQNIHIEPDSFRLLYWIPAVCALSSPFLLLLFFFLPRPFSLLALSPFAVYGLSALLSATLAFSRHGNPSRAVLQFFLYPVVHLSYAYGFLHSAGSKERERVVKEQCHGRSA